MSDGASLQGRTAIVTGGSRGLGRGVVEALSGRGARVVALARNEAQLAMLASEVSGVRTVTADAADETTAARLVREESPDLVVLCAGASPTLAPVHQQSWSEFSGNWEVDAKSTFVWLQEALKLPLKPGSHVVVISSGAAVAGSPVSGGYASAKRAQWFIADYAAAEVQRAQLAIKIHCLLPNLNPSTELGRHAIAAYAERAGVAPDEFAKRFAPFLTPAIFGAAVADLFTTPEKWPQLTWRIGGNGLAPLG